MFFRPTFFSNIYCLKMLCSNFMPNAITVVLNERKRFICLAPLVLIFGELLLLFWTVSIELSVVRMSPTQTNMHESQSRSDFVLKRHGPFALSLILFLTRKPFRQQFRATFCNRQTVFFTTYNFKCFHEKIFLFASDKHFVIQNVDVFTLHASFFASFSFLLQ